MELTITPDRGYLKDDPSSPDMVYYIEGTGYRWRVDVKAFRLKETGQSIYKAHSISQGMDTYGLTANEAVNEMRDVMRLFISKWQKEDSPELEFERIKYYLAPDDALRIKDEIKGRR